MVQKCRKLRQNGCAGPKLVTKKFIFFGFYGGGENGHSSSSSSSESHEGGRGGHGHGHEGRPRPPRPPLRPRPSREKTNCPADWMLFKRSQGNWCVQVFVGTMTQYQAEPLCVAQGAVLYGLQNDDERMRMAGMCFMKFCIIWYVAMNPMVQMMTIWYMAMNHMV
ncbi:hypothetical protein L5515_009422 [Caenorhabditis briggsae]|uniref:C-type lectin domain-containing protein n=1 Tax=Caenorhabditis briggsae TaxID=6238 RepID=A0AAE9JNP0_CAEBR|nr:hypothetical protein L5515_009422 [Caenorhabditis briggsae]